MSRVCLTRITVNGANYVPYAMINRPHEVFGANRGIHSKASRGKFRVFRGSRRTVSADLA